MLARCFRSNCLRLCATLCSVCAFFIQRQVALFPPNKQSLHYVSTNTSNSRCVSDKSVPQLHVFWKLEIPSYHCVPRKQTIDGDTEGKNWWAKTGCGSLSYVGGLRLSWSVFTSCTVGHPAASVSAVSMVKQSLLTFIWNTASTLNT